jgi:uncharacterized protein
VEYAPLVLIAMGLAESMQAHPLALHAMGLLLVVGRLLHAFGVSQTREKFIFRVTGMALTLSAVGVAAVVTFIASVA